MNNCFQYFIGVENNLYKYYPIQNPYLLTLIYTKNILNIHSDYYINEDSIPLILKEQKEDFSNKIKGIYDDLNTKIVLSQLASEQNDRNELLSNEHFQNIKYLGKNRLFIAIIFLGVLIFVTHLISIYDRNGIMITIEEELIASIHSYIKNENREEEDDFYQNFNKLNGRLPDYSVFFITSVFSEYLDESLGHTFLIIFILIINFIILFFGFKEYEFNIERKNYKNYSLNQFMHLYIIYLFLCIFEGFIALLPLKIIKEGFIFYENYKKKLEKKEKTNEIYNNNTKENIIDVNDLNKIENNNNIQNNNIQSNNIENDNIDKNKEKNDNNIQNKDNLDNIIYIDKDGNQKKQIKIKQEYKKFGGYLPFYLASISCSIILKIFLDKIYIDEYNYDSRNNANYYLIISYCIFTCFSLLIYLLFWRCIIKIKEEKNKNTIKSKINICGYFIYSETIQNEDICCYSCYECGECCEDCKICCKTLNSGLCFYCCTCVQCWKCIFCNCKHCDNVETPKTIKDINKLENICIIYRLTGRWNYLASLITLPIIYIYTIILYYIYITNFGFEERIWNNLKKK